MLLCWCRNLSPFTHRTSIWLDRLLGTHVPWVKRRHASCFFPTPCLKFARSWLWEFFGLSGGTTFLIINIKKYSSQPSCVHIVSSSYYYARWNRRPPKPIININALKKEGINVMFSFKKRLSSQRSQHQILSISICGFLDEYVDQNLFCHIDTAWLLTALSAPHHHNSSDLKAVQ